MQPLIDTPRGKGRPSEPSSIEDEARAVAQYLDRGLQNYSLKLSELWPPALGVAEKLEGRRGLRGPDFDGYAWVRSQFSRLRRGFYEDSRGIKRGVSHRVQRDLYRLIANHPKSRARFATDLKSSGFHGDEWILESRKFPAMQSDLFQPEISAIIDPNSIRLLAIALAGVLFTDNVITERRDEARRSIEAYLISNGHEMAWIAAKKFPLKCKHEIDRAIAIPQPDSIGVDIISAIALKLWPTH